MSNTLASTLWAVDYGLAMAQADVTALAFHIPEGGCNSYTPICLVGHGTNAHWHSTPEYQGLLALAALEGCHLHAARVEAHHDHVRAYGLTRASGARELVVLDLDPEHHVPMRLTWDRMRAPAPATARVEAQMLGGTRYDSSTVRAATPIPVTRPPLANRTVQTVLAPGSVTTLEEAS